MVDDEHLRVQDGAVRAQQAPLDRCPPRPGGRRGWPGRSASPRRPAARQPGVEAGAEHAAARQPEHPLDRLGVGDHRRVGRDDGDDVGRRARCSARKLRSLSRTSRLRSSATSDARRRAAVLEEQDDEQRPASATTITEPSRSSARAGAPSLGRTVRRIAARARRTPGRSSSRRSRRPRPSRPIASSTTSREPRPRTRGGPPPGRPPGNPRGACVEVVDDGFHPRPTASRAPAHRPAQRDLAGVDVRPDALSRSTFSRGPQQRRVGLAAALLVLIDLGEPDGHRDDHHRRREQQAGSAPRSAPARAARRRRAAIDTAIAASVTAITIPSMCTART